VRDRRRMDDHLHAADRIDNGFPRAKVRGDHLGPRGESGHPTARTDDGADVVAREDGSAHDSPSDQSPRAEDRNPHAHRTIAATEKDDAFEGANRLRARCMHEPGLCRPCDRRRKARFGEADEVGSMRTGIKLGPRAAAFVAVLIAASAVGILTPTLSNTVSKDVQVTGFAVTLTVDGIPDSVAPGGVFRVVATMSNN